MPWVTLIIIQVLLVAILTEGVQHRLARRKYILCFLFPFLTLQLILLLSSLLLLLLTPFCHCFPSTPDFPPAYHPTHGTLPLSIFVWELSSFLYFYLCDHDVNILAKTGHLEVEVEYLLICMII